MKRAPLVLLLALFLPLVGHNVQAGEEQKPALEFSPLFYALVLTAAGTLAVGFVPRVFMTLTAGASPF